MAPKRARSLAREIVPSVRQGVLLHENNKTNNKQNMTVTRQTVQLDGIHLVCRAQVPGSITSELSEIEGCRDRRMTN